MNSLEWAGEDNFGYYYYKETVAGGATSDPVLLPFNVTISAAVYPLNRAKIQATISTKEDVENGTANWVDWNLGVVNQNSSDALVGAATAIRLVSEQGEATMEVIGR